MIAGRSPRHMAAVRIAHWIIALSVLGLFVTGTGMDLAGIRPEARYAVFVPFANPKQDRSVVRVLWDSIDMADAAHPQTLLAYGMNGEELPAGHGAPVRLRVARQLGYKNVKYLSRITVTDNIDAAHDPTRRGPWYGGI